jgi:hypothetical protein
VVRERRRQLARLRRAARGALAHRRSAGEIIAPRPTFRPGLAAVAGGLLCLGLALAGCAADWARIPARGEIQGRPIATTVDAPIARYYLEHHLPGRRTDPDLDRRISAALAALPEEPGRAAFQELSAELSVDTATMHLIERLTAAPPNARMTTLFQRELERIRALRGAPGERLAACVRAFELPTLLFAPGWFYRSNPGTGADFARQRALFERLGVDTRLIPVVENGTVEGNAAIIAEAIRRLHEAGQPAILVSASKGGPEVAHALGRVLDPQATDMVQAWINVGGLLLGAPLADWAEAWPQRWLTGLYYWHQGLDPAESIASLTTQRSRARFAQQTIPEHVLIVNFVGVPLSGHISRGAEFGYARTRPVGPNDGLTAIVDELAHGGPAILQVGLDHYYRDPELDLKTLALALTVMLELGHPLPEACAP